MKTELRVIDLGNGHGKVVRKFFPDSERESIPRVSVIQARYRAGLITRTDLEYYLRNLGYHPRDVGIFIRLAGRR